MAALYRRTISVLDKFVPPKLQPIWNHEAGPKTVHFWAPVVKWGLVVAGISDLARPASNLSVQQCGALAATGFIWSRYSLVIIPKNWGLFSVNFFIGLTQSVQLYRAYDYHYNVKGKEQQETEAVSQEKVVA
ncbi:mitochondrial pyruvate carrier 2-like [Onthophagus taurus]|uniref:mitochondrial pyruvate carrier 2-like n=1 Tax=Onthophagus taurus TaxID=166361 RepID=UPI000C208426|nr:mitochondrial pyruvate carrier 2-like [Onthophagus taurus]